METVVLHFTDVYDSQNLDAFRTAHHIDCRSITGADCFCSEDAAKILKEKIASCSSFGIHFLDSGNYHYMTKFWTDQITEPFSLLLFDQHTDLQSSGLFPILSCGSWVKYMLEENPYLQQVLIVGPSKQAMEQDLVSFSESVRKRISFLPLEPFPDHAKTFIQTWLKNQNKIPYYLSIDKDLLSPQEVVTNWDQGNVSLDTLLTLLSASLNEGHCIGADICGECQPNLDFLDLSKASHVNQKANSILYDMCRKILFLPCKSSDSQKN